MINDINEEKKLNFISLVTKKDSKIIKRKKNYNLLIGIFFLITIQLLFFAFNYILFKKNLTPIFIPKNSQEKAKKTNLKTFLIEGKEKFSEIIRIKYSLQQILFCQNKILFRNALIDEMIKSVKIKFNEMAFNMLVYKKKDAVSNRLSINGFWEVKSTQSILTSLLYYSKKKNIEKNDIFILDIGANIGWYSLILGKKGYNIISFEPSQTNYYILMRNFCLNKEINITIINSGLDKEAKNTILYHPFHNIGNAYTFDGVKKINFTKYSKEVIKLSKLSDYIEYLSSKNLALIKLDIEGSEAKAIEGGIDLIIKYHTPFIFMEWTPDIMRLKGSDPKLLLEMFENNDYKISTKNFFDKENIPLEKLLNEKETNIYITYKKFIE